ncbi:TPA: hypothetical protein OUB62_001762 [Serratia liquefaciens]|nr:hypothetical protein [Serratia liquefaciens]
MITTIIILYERISIYNFLPLRLDWRSTRTFNEPTMQTASHQQNTTKQNIRHYPQR